MLDAIVSELFSSLNSSVVIVVPFIFSNEDSSIASSIHLITQFLSVEVLH